jgi:hypothetical protein
LRYLAAPWPVDDLLNMFLSETAPQQYTLEPENVRLEIRGARGVFSIARLEAGDFAFRQMIAAGWSIGSAAERAAESDPTLDAGAALVTMLTAELVTAIDHRNQGEQQ